MSAAASCWTLLPPSPCASAVTARLALALLAPRVAGDLNVNGYRD